MVHYKQLLQKSSQQYIGEELQEKKEQIMWEINIQNVMKALRYSRNNRKHGTERIRVELEETLLSRC